MLGGLLNLPVLLFPRQSNENNNNRASIMAFMRIKRDRLYTALNAMSGT